MRHAATISTLCSLTLLAGCAGSGVSSKTGHPIGPSENIELTSIPSGVNVEVPGFGTVRTPANIELAPEDAHELRFYLHGFEDRVVTVEPGIGQWTNHATGRRHSLEPAFIHLDMASGERLMTGSELAAWANAESERALADSQQTLATVAGLVRRERESFSNAERAKIAALRALERVDAIRARDTARAAVIDAAESRKRARALMEEQQSLTMFALDELAAAETALQAAEAKEAAAVNLAKVAANIRKAAEREERKLAVQRGQYPEQSLDEALAIAMPEYPAGFEQPSGFADVDPDTQ